MKEEETKEEYPKCETCGNCSDCCGCKLLVQTKKCICKKFFIDPDCPFKGRMAQCPVNEKCIHCGAEMNKDPKKQTATNHQCRPCVCGAPEIENVIHLKDSPCYYDFTNKCNNDWHWLDVALQNYRNYVSGKDGETPYGVLKNEIKLFIQTESKEITNQVRGSVLSSAIEDITNLKDLRGVHTDRWDYYNQGINTALEVLKLLQSSKL